MPETARARSNKGKERNAEGRGNGSPRPHVEAGPRLDPLAGLLNLQRMAGNHAVNQLLAGAVGGNESLQGVGVERKPNFNGMSAFAQAPVTVQKKLKVSSPGDGYEQEADRIADRVMAMPARQRASSVTPRIQRLSGEANGRTDVVPDSVKQTLASPGKPLDSATRSLFEPRFGHDFSQVRVHTDTLAAESAKAVNAQAYTVGDHVVFGQRKYKPRSLGGLRLLAHELTHVVQQGHSRSLVQLQPALNVAPANDQIRREFVRDTIKFLEGSASYYQSPNVPIDRALFDRVIDGWYAAVVNQERIIDNDLGGDRALKADLRAAYISAIRVLISRAAAALGKSEAELYSENSGRIPLWAWQTPHHMEQFISTPIPEGRVADKLTGAVNFSTNGFDVSIMPDALDPALGNHAETRQNIQGGRINYQRQSRRGRRIVTNFNGPGTPAVTIQTFYGRGVTAASPSDYGRGTTPEDIAGGRVTPRSTSLGLHEGSHGLDYIDFLETNPAPQFTGAVGMTEAQFRAAIRQYQRDLRDYANRMEEFSTRRTDCVGTTIDQFDQANGAAGAQVIIQCGP
ncbi:hypothetical protein Noc_1858 [Nitrosococcus oceani ATCC 19707]|uniref:eCIS core domain-containing protein n=2 Tax=Nitrosococcus oceani TaxID=1229 RepID=Q3JA22_NITOC|nr:DUF4157 domain-containing protein [Nitrosococcus oceani]ABA58324.1 hypothetical protein Noc_1858 [Nitrosococcus oceani ATCC 19707]EDZ67366.1 hypothetical protein NOC27_693 [Nitrosococcus oceani AFC27]KFI19254.1 hypothetical protein IB75_09900 [Nitrosococcus oceani C-27]GEM18713.1 hypothetical protein NONS58_00700 [Nitrosococcus oceani]